LAVSFLAIPIMYVLSRRKLALAKASGKGDDLNGEERP
jgi:hypothetical protein